MPSHLKMMTQIPMTTIPYDSIKLQRPKKRTRFVLLTDTFVIDNVVDAEENNAFVHETEITTDGDNITNGVNDDHESKNGLNTNRINITVHYVESYKSTLTDDEKYQYWYSGTDFDRFSREFEQYQQQMLDDYGSHCNKPEINGENNHRKPKPKHIVKNKDWANQVNAILGIDVDRNIETTTTTRSKVVSPENDQEEHHVPGVDNQGLGLATSTATPQRRMRRVRLRRSKNLTDSRNKD